MLSIGKTDRPAGRHYPLQGLLAAIDETRVDDSLMALSLLATRFRFRSTSKMDNDAVADFLEIRGAILHAEVERPGRLQ
jgi:hypothetical protein